MTNDPVYLDHHATTPCDPAVLEAMWPYFATHFGNAGSRSHPYGLTARQATEHARGQVAAWLGASPKEVVFTSGATESDNLAILGVVRARSGPRHVITVASEHSAVLDPVAVLEGEGVEVTVLPVGSDGLIDPDDVIAAFRPHTVLVSVMRVNNEIGVIQPLRAIGEACRVRGIWLHTDAAQAAYVPVDRDDLLVDLISVSAHKIFGPKGIGALIVRRTRPTVDLQPLQFGGGQERGIRSGTLPVPLIVGLGQAAALVAEGHDNGASNAIASLRDRLFDGLARHVGEVSINGSTDHRAPNNLHVTFANVEASPLMAAVQDRVALSSGSACSAESLKPSHVLTALGMSPERARQSVRFGLGRSTTADQVDEVVGILGEAAARLRG